MNYTIPPKKMVIINILDILKRYTDENHKLSQKQIADILKNEYNTVVERKTCICQLKNGPLNRLKKKMYYQEFKAYKYFEGVNQ